MIQWWWWRWRWCHTNERSFPYGRIVSCSFSCSNVWREWKQVLGIFSKLVLLCCRCKRVKEFSAVALITHMLIYFSANVVSYAMPNDRNVQNCAHKRCIWMVLRRCACDNAGSIHQNEQNAIHSPAIGIDRASLLQIGKWKEKQKKKQNILLKGKYQF